MDWLNRMNSAIKFIEDNLCEEIDYCKVAEIACCSVYHFQRMFSFITDIPLSEYIRRRRLTLAAFELQNSDARIIDLAVKYGYDSADSFSRAFHRMHGVLPSLARGEGVKLKSYAPISFHISIKGDVEMNYRIVEGEEQKVFGKSITIGAEEDSFKVIPKFWDSFQEDGTYQKICKVGGFEPYNENMLNAACYDFKNNSEYKFKYIIYTKLPANVNIPKDLDIFTIPKCTYAAFEATFEKVEDCSAAIQNIWSRIFTEWFPNSGYEVAPGPQLEIYECEEGKAEVWIPIIKK